MSPTGRCEVGPVSDTPAMPQVPAGSGRKRDRWIALGCAAFAVGMVGAAYAAVPLYRMFCQATGFGGSTYVAETAPTETLARTMHVRFDANVAPGLNLDFRPEHPLVEAKLG